MSAAGRGRAGAMAASGEGEGSSSTSMRFNCRTCGVGFAAAAAHKEHHRSEWHAYNLKRSLLDLPPLPFEQFCRKLQLALLAVKLKEAAAQGDRRAVEAAAADAVLETLQQQQQHQQHVPLPTQGPHHPEQQEVAVGEEASSSSRAALDQSEAAGKEAGRVGGGGPRQEDGSSRDKAAALAAAAAALIGVKLKGDAHVKVGGKRSGLEARGVTKKGEEDAATAVGKVAAKAAPAAARGVVGSNSGPDVVDSSADEEADASSSKAAAAAATLPGATDVARAGAGGAAAAARELALQQKPECVSLFDNHPPFQTWQQNLRYMRKVFSFVPPDEEYITNMPLFLRIIWQQQQRRPRCLLCGRRFAAAAAAQQHMQQKGHTQLQWESDPQQQTRLQQKLLAACYDYRQSYLRLLEKRLEQNETLQLQQAEAAALQEPGHARQQLPSSAAAEEEEEDSSEWEDASEDAEESEDESACGAAAAADNRSAAAAAGKRRTTAAAHTSGSPFDDLSQEQLEELLVKHGVGPATVTDTGSLRLPDRRELINRHVAYIYKQRRRAARIGTRGTRAAAEALVLEDMQQRPTYMFSRVLARGRGLRAYAAAMARGNRQPVFLDMQKCITGTKGKTSPYRLSTDRQMQLAIYPGLLRCLQQQPATSLAQRKRVTRKQQVSYVRLGVKQNKLQKHMRLEHKYFF